MTPEPADPRPAGQRPADPRAADLRAADLRPAPPPDEDCPRQGDAVAWVQGELGPAESADFARHVQACAGCRTLARDATVLLRSLAAAPQRRRLPAFARWSPLAAAALVLASLVLREAPTRDAGRAVRFAAVDAAPVAWIESQLGADGTWDERSWSSLGRGREVGIHAFALLALARGVEPDPEPARLQRLERAADWLVERQQEDGLVGDGPGPAGFDHPVATLALLEAWRVTERDELGAAADRAVRRIAAEDDAGRSAGQAAWTVAALLRAEELGLPDLRPAIERHQAAPGTPAVLRSGHDVLSQQAFWTVALGGERRPRAAAAPDLFSASADLLAVR